MRDVAVPKKRPVPMTPPILEARVSGGGPTSTEGYIPDHSDMAVLQLSMEGSVDLERFCL